MKFGKHMCMLAALTLLLPLSVLAADKSEHHENFTLNDAVQIGNTQLKPGNYKAEWSGNGPTVQVQILQGKKTVATVPAQVVENKQASPYNDVIVKPTTGNTKTIDEIDFANKKEALKLTPAQSSGM